MKKYKNLLIIEGSIILTILSVILLINSKFINLIAGCTYNKLTGLLCPTCGGTRCVYSILNGRYYDAMKFNALIFLAIIYFSIINLIYIFNTVFNKKVLKMLYPKWWHTIIIGIIVILFTIFRNIF